MQTLKKIVPSLCTLANLIFGLIALIYIFNGYTDWAAVFIIMGMLFDGFDGRLARLLGVSSEFGKQLDSLSDLVTFGVVWQCWLTPAAYQLGSSGHYCHLAFSPDGSFEACPL